MSTAFLGWIIEEVTGRPLAEFIDSRITSPLGMLDTAPGLAPEKHPRLVATYHRVNGEMRGEPRPEEYQPAFRGDGGLLSTADDYARFIQLMLRDGEWEGKRFLSPESVAEMVRDQLDGLVVTEQPGVQPELSHPFPMGAGRDGFGLGFQVSAEGSPAGRAAGSLSWAGIQNTHFWIDRENGVGGVMMMALLPFYDPGAIELLTSFERMVYRSLGIGPSS
jgi:CubicO group peptidase (beta-lactamase class C family)